MDPETVVVWLAYPWLRYLTNRSRVSSRYDIALAVDPFEVRRVTEGDAQLVCSIPWFDYHYDIRLHEGRLFRRVMSEGMLPADIVQLGNTALDELVEGRADSFEWDHPAAIRKTYLLSDEPLSYAPTSMVARPRFWGLRNDPSRVKGRLQALLGGYLVIDGALWCPTPAPAIWITVPAGGAKLYFGDMPRFRMEGIQIDWEERHLVADVLSAMGRYADDSATFRYVMEQDWHLPVDAGDAVWRMLEQCVVSMKNAGSKRMAASGPDLLAAFWAGRQVLDQGGRTEALDWHARHARTLSSSGVPPIARAIKLFDDRVRLQSQTWEQTWHV